MNLKLILDILIQVFLQPEVNTFLWIFFAVVYIIGLWGVFRKCGIRPWWALVPVVRDAKLGEAADMEKETPAPVDCPGYPRGNRRILFHFKSRCPGPGPDRQPGRAHGPGFL